jgi:hypothetical protein
MLRLYWINIYLGLPYNIIYNTRKNFVSTEFKQYVKSIVIQVEKILVKNL